MNPRLQVQFAEPSVLIQTAFSSHWLESGAHSFTSERIRESVKKKKTLRDYVIRCVEEQLKTQQYAPTPTNVIRFSSRKGRTTSRSGAMRFKTLASLLLPQEMGCRCISQHLTNWLANCQRSGIPFSWRVRQIC